MSTLENEIAGVATKFCTDSLGLKPKESVLIISNPHSQDLVKISGGFYGVSKGLEANPTLVYQPKKGQLDFMEEAVRYALMSNPSVVMTFTEDKIGKDRVGINAPYKLGNREYNHYFNLLIKERISRATMGPRMTIDSFLRAADVNYHELRFIVNEVGIKMDYSDSIHITSKAGTDFTANIKDKKSHCWAGDLRRLGTAENCLPGEVFVSPVPGYSQGTLVFDGLITTLDECIIPKDPVTVKVLKGKISEIEGGIEAEKLRETLDKAIGDSKKLRYPLNNKKIGEIGIGLNPKAAIVPNISEAEKALTTCHIAFGRDYDGMIQCLTHLDHLIRDPTIELNKEHKKFSYVLMENGKLNVKLPKVSTKTDICF